MGGVFDVNHFGRSATIILAGYRQGDGSLTAAFERMPPSSSFYAASGGAVP